MLTLSGAMTIAKMGKIISTMIDRGMVHAIVSTGALVAHGLSESVGKLHYRHDASRSDEELFRKGYNRVYDTLEMESNLNYVEHVVSLTLKRINSDQPSVSALLTRELGKTLTDEFEGPGILKSAYLKNVPVYIPHSPIPRWASTWAHGPWVNISIGLAVKPRRAGTSQCCVPCTRLARSLIPISISITTRKKYWVPSGSAFSPSAAGFLATGLNRSRPTLRSVIRALGLNVQPPRFHYGVRICPNQTTGEG